jgi:hypothetical protein
MFELLLQADKALADGSLDQAERTYWQLIELDSQNAIAVAGLARVALERGDEKKARQFADQALGIDPDSIAARRIIDSLSHTGARVVDDPIAQQMLGAERLEALSHRRAADTGATDDDKAPSQARGQRRPGGAEARGDVAETARPEQAAGGDADDVAAATGSGPTAEAESPAPAGSPGAQQSRGRTRPDQMEPMPAEPLRERRKAGRLAAAAAAAAAAAREPVKARHQSHHAMPIGRRFFEAADLKPPTVDEFSEAEMAAAIEAVDAVDEPVLPAQQRRKGAALGRGLGQADLLGAVEATDPDESVALRLALVAEALELDAAENEAAQPHGEAVDFDEEANDSFEAAEAVASSSLHASRPAVRATQPTYLIDPDEDFDAAEAEAEAAVARPEAVREPVAAPAEPEAGSRAEVAGGSGDAMAALADAAEAAEAAEAAAEAAAAAEAMKEISRADVAAEPQAVPIRRPFTVEAGEEPSEAEAEAQALREALALVLDAEPPGGPEDGPGSERESIAKAGARPAADGEPGPAAATPESDPASTTEPAAKTEPAATTEPQPRRGGIFRRIRGG